MAIEIYNTYTPRAVPPSAEYPGGALKDASAPGVYDGTPLSQAWGNDVQGFLDALLLDGGVPYSGDRDTALLSDRLQALKNIIRERVGYIYVTGGGQLEVNEKYLIGDSDTYTLPNTTSLTLDDRVDIYKLADFTPIIQVDGTNGEQIKFYRPNTNTLEDTDTSALFNIYSPLYFIYNTDWEL